MAVIGKEQTQSKIRIDAAFKLFDKVNNLNNKWLEYFNNSKDGNETL